MSAQGLDYYVKSMLKSILVPKDILTWLLTSWQLCATSQSDASFENLCLINMDFN